MFSEERRMLRDVLEQGFEARVLSKRNLI